MAHFGWTLHYLTEGIAWAIVLRMMADAPRYDYDAKEEVQEVKPQDARAFFASIGTFDDGSTEL